MSTYDIRPSLYGHGVALNDSGGRHLDLWFRNAGAAVEYAAFSARRDGGTIRVFGASGTLQLEREVRSETPRRGERHLEFVRG